MKVLQHALRVWNVSIVPLNSPDGITAKQHPEYVFPFCAPPFPFQGLCIHEDSPLTTEAMPIHIHRNEEAFICNLLSHWFTIRKVGDHFFNFNSLLPKPTYLKEFYLKYAQFDFLCSAVGVSALTMYVNYILCCGLISGCIWLLLPKKDTQFSLPEVCSRP